MTSYDNVTKFLDSDFEIFEFFNVDRLEKPKNALPEWKIHLHPIENAILKQMRV